MCTSISFILQKFVNINLTVKMRNHTWLFCNCDQVVFEYVADGRRGEQPLSLWLFLIEFTGDSFDEIISFDQRLICLENGVYELLFEYVCKYVVEFLLGKDQICVSPKKLIIFFVFLPIFFIFLLHFRVNFQFMIYRTSALNIIIKLLIIRSQIRLRFLNLNARFLLLQKILKKFILVLFGENF